MPQIGDYNSKITPYRPGESAPAIRAPNFAGPEGAIGAGRQITSSAGELANDALRAHGVARDVAVAAGGILDSAIASSVNVYQQRLDQQRALQTAAINAKNKMANISATSDIITDARQQTIAKMARYAAPTGDTNQFNDKANDDFLDQHKELWDSKLDAVQARNDPESLKMFEEAKNESVLNTTKELFNLQQKAQERQAVDRWDNIKQGMDTAVIENGANALPSQLDLLNKPETLKAAIIAGKGSKDDIDKFKQGLLQKSSDATLSYVSNNTSYMTQAKGDVLAGLTLQATDIKKQLNSLANDPLYQDFANKDKAVRSLNELNNAVLSDRNRAIDNVNAQNTTILEKNKNDIAIAEQNGDASSIARYGQVFTDELNRAMALPLDQQDPKYIKALVNANEYAGNTANAIQTKTAETVKEGVEETRGSITDQIQQENRQRELDRQQATAAHDSDEGVIQRSALLEVLSKKRAQWEINSTNSGLHAGDIAELKTLWNDAKAHKAINPTEADKILHSISELQDKVQPTSLAPDSSLQARLWRHVTLGADFKGASDGLVQYVGPKTDVEKGKLNDEVNAAYAQIATSKALSTYKTIPGWTDNKGNLTPEAYGQIWQKANEMIGAKYATGAASKYQMPPARKAEVKPQKPGIIETPGGRRPAGNYLVPPPPPSAMNEKEMLEYMKRHPEYR
jgi:hypothetical protein